MEDIQVVFYSFIPSFAFKHVSLFSVCCLVLSALYSMSFLCTVQSFISSNGVLYGVKVKTCVLITGSFELAQEVHRRMLQLAGSSNDPIGRLDGITHIATGNQNIDIYVCPTGFSATVSFTVCWKIYCITFLD